MEDYGQLDVKQFSLRVCPFCGAEPKIDLDNIVCPVCSTHVPFIDGIEVLGNFSSCSSKLKQFSILVDRWNGKGVKQDRGVVFRCVIPPEWR